MIATAYPEDVAFEERMIEFMPQEQWQDITTAPKHGWFLALRAPKFTGPTSCRVAVIHRVEGVGFGPWEGSEEAYYKADFFSHWMPFPELSN